MTVRSMTAAAAESAIRELESQRRSPIRAKDLAAPKTSSTVRRWWKFNLVGGIGIAVQFAALFLLKGLLHINYLLATAIAVEVAVLHNFVWHERFTWADRVELKTKIFYEAAQPRPDSLLRLLRFHLANGAISIFGNLALMKLMVGLGHMNYLAANALAIALCSLANFIASEQWVFEKVVKN